MSAKKNNALNNLPRFIWGEAVSQDGLDDHEYLTHTRYPRFICRVYEGEDAYTELGGLDSVIGLHPQTQEPIYCTSRDIHLKDFAWLDKGGIPPAEAVKLACDEAMLNYMMRDDEYGINDDD